MQTFQSNVEAIDAHNAQDLGWTVCWHRTAAIYAEEWLTQLLLAAGYQPVR